MTKNIYIKQVQNRSLQLDQMSRLNSKTEGEDEGHSLAAGGRGTVLQSGGVGGGHH